MKTMASRRGRWSVARAAAVVAVAVAPAACSGATSTGDDDEGARPGPAPAGRADGADVLHDWLDRLVPWGFRGAVGLVDGGEVVLAAGFGSVDGAEAGTAAPIDADTRFAVGSITKDFVDLSILLLEHRGLLDVGRPIGQLLPDVPADKAEISVAHLMAHTAGFHHVHGRDDEPIDRDEALDRIFAQELRFAPGTDEYYSNSGYTLLAAVVEEVSGHRFDDFLRRELFRPAGMADTGFEGDPLPAGRQDALGVDDAGEPSTPSERPLGWALRGNGGMVSTVTDLLAFDRALCSGQVLPEELVDPLGSCGTAGAFGSAGGGSEYSHTAAFEKDMDSGITLVVLAADGRLPAEEVAFAVLDHVTAGDALPRVPAAGDGTSFRLDD